MPDERNVKIVKLGSGEKYQRLFNKDSGTSGMRSGHVILKPGEEIGEHTTGELEEILVILKGNAELNVNKSSLLKIEERAAAYIPPDTSHNVRNPGPGLLEYIFITSKKEDLVK